MFWSSRGKSLAFSVVWRSYGKSLALSVLRWSCGKALALSVVWWSYGKSLAFSVVWRSFGTSLAFSVVVRWFKRFSRASGGLSGPPPAAPGAISTAYLRALAIVPPQILRFGCDFRRWTSAKCSVFAPARQKSTWGAKKTTPRQAQNPSDL